jgi:hypothetical protein
MAKSNQVRTGVNLYESVSPLATVCPWTQDQSQRMHPSMDTFRRGQHSYLGAGAKTSLGACLTELKH